MLVFILCLSPVHMVFLSCSYCVPIIKGVNPCSNMGGIILGRNIHPACWMYCAKRRAYLGLFGGMLPREIFSKWCNLVHFGVYLDQILSLKNFKNYYFLYIKFCKLSFLYKNFKNYYFLYKK